MSAIHNNMVALKDADTKRHHTASFEAEMLIKNARAQTAKLVWELADDELAALVRTTTGYRERDLAFIGEEARREVIRRFLAKNKDQR